MFSAGFFAAAEPAERKIHVLTREKIKNHSCLKSFVSTVTGTGSMSQEFAGKIPGCLALRLRGIAFHIERLCLHRDSLCGEGVADQIQRML